MILDDPTTDKDAVGYLVEQAMHSHPNGREVSLIEKCAEYLREAIRSERELTRLVNDTQRARNCLKRQVAKAQALAEQIVQVDCEDPSHERQSESTSVLAVHRIKGRGPVVVVRLVGEASIGWHLRRERDGAEWRIRGLETFQARPPRRAREVGLLITESGHLPEQGDEVQVIGPPNSGSFPDQREE